MPLFARRRRWSSCDKDLLYRVLKLQKRAARIILYADRLDPPVTLFNKLGGYLFMNRVKLTNVLFFYKRINGSLPGYLNDHLQEKMRGQRGRLRALDGIRHVHEGYF